MKKRIAVILSFIGITVFIACGGSEGKKTEKNTHGSVETAPVESTRMLDYKVDGPKGVGPITSFEHKTFDTALANEGVELFVSKCAMCHGFDRTLVGPSLDGVIRRRTPEWIMNMMLDPAKMLEEDPDAKELSKGFPSPMISVGLKPEEARAILEYLRERNSAAK